MLQLKNIKKVYVTSSENVQALRDVSISFRKTEFVSILGPSGCGKTTLLNIIGGLDHYTDGDLLISGRSTKSFGDRDWDVYRNHKVGFIFQSYNLIPHQTVLGNVELALTITGIGKEERVRRAKEALDRVGLAGQYYKRPNQLSGGQCQRVAIARALVNDPEILLADEPTGALDTVTSVQIMELVKEISRERLVIMVTHNPELAEQYSTRIVRLLDGNVTEDTNPMTDGEVKSEADAEAEKKAKEDEALRALGAKEEKRARKMKRRREEKAKMSFFTAFKLSFRNLLSKKGRTTMVGIAGSIGIIGIAMVLAFSAGIKGYIASMQDDMLSGNPITITETAYDLSMLTGMIEDMAPEEFEKLPGHAYINSLVTYLAKMQSKANAMVIKNNLTEDYVNYVLSMDKSQYAAMITDYGIQLENNIYTSFKTSSDADAKNHSITVLTSIYTSVLQQTEFGTYADYATSIVPSFKQSPNNSDYISSQYDVHGKVATEKDEIMLVLNSDQKLTDILLARLGYYTQDEFLNIVYKATENEDTPEADRHYTPELDREFFTYEELMNKSFTWYPNNTVFNDHTETPLGKMNPFTYNSSSEGFSNEGSIDLKVVGILIPKETISYGCLSSGIYYTEALAKHIIDTEKETPSNIVSYLANEAKDNSITSMSYMGMNVGITYNYSFTYNGVTHDNTVGFIGSPFGAEDIMSGMMSGGQGGQGSQGGQGGAGMMSISSARVLSLRSVGGDSLPTSISIYPNTFVDKDQVTKYLDDWNSELPLTLGDKTLTAEERDDVTYTDTLELVINLINTMIDVVSYALIAFTSVSLVVSTVMIGIITYVSVVERVKEIGVIRSLGGRKKDVSHLFNAETFIIGLIAGLIGVGFTYLISIPVNLILAPLINYSGIAALPVSNALILIALSITLTLISGLIPSRSAAKKDPVVALRTE